MTLNNGGVFTGRGRLMERPQKPYFDIFDEKGIFYEQKDGVLTIRGEWSAGEYRLPGNVSSQFVTGLLYALPLMEWESRIVLTSPLESRGYVDMTLDVLDHFGVRAEVLEDGFWSRETRFSRHGILPLRPTGLRRRSGWQRVYWGIRC